MSVYAARAAALVVVDTQEPSEEPQHERHLSEGRILARARVKAWRCRLCRWPVAARQGSCRHATTAPRPAVAGYRWRLGECWSPRCRLLLVAVKMRWLLQNCHVRVE